MNQPPANSEHAVAPASRSALLIVFLVIFIDLLGFGIVLPLLPVIGELYIERVVGKGIAAGAMLGLLMASFSLMQFFFAPTWGRVSDRHGRRPILLIGLIGSVFFYSLFGFAASLDPNYYSMLALVLFFVARIGAGISGATIATAQAVIADSTPPEKRKHGMALIGAAFGIGALAFQHGWAAGPMGFESQGYLTSWAPLFFFTLVFAVSMDYTVFLLSVAREHFERDGDAKAAIRKAIGETGRPIVAAAGVMVAVFFTFALAGPLPMKEMGLILGVSVVIDAFVVRIFLLPAFLSLVGRHGWWLPRWADRVLPDIRFAH